MKNAGCNGRSGGGGVRRRADKFFKYFAENPADTQKDIVAVIGISEKGVGWNLKTLKNGRF